MNYLGSDEEAAGVINNICEQVSVRDFYYQNEWKILDDHYNAYWPNVPRHCYFYIQWCSISRDQTWLCCTGHKLILETEIELNTMWSQKKQKNIFTLNLLDATCSIPKSWVNKGAAKRFFWRWLRETGGLVAAFTSDDPGEHSMSIPSSVEADLSKTIVYRYIVWHLMIYGVFIRYVCKQTFW